LYFLDDESGQLSVLDKVAGTSSSIGSPIGVDSSNLALSPSDDASQLFASNGIALLRINIHDGTPTIVAEISGIDVNEWSMRVGDSF
jgi:hypothetical protein